VRLSQGLVQLRLRLGVRTAAVVLASCAALSAACGGNAAPQAASTVAPSASVSPAVAASPQRPPLASPSASPSPAGAAGVAPSPAPDAGGGETYEVASGDTLLTIAEKQYGDATQWRRIYEANQDVIGSNPDALKIGMKLKIPPKQ
jgi:5'-nucleotidase/UDP-sugar diphosphatase